MSRASVRVMRNILDRAPSLGSDIVHAPARDGGTPVLVSGP